MSSEFRSHPDPATWDDYTDFESTSWPKKERRRYWIIPSICFNCESACGILAYVDKETLDVRKIEGNPVHPGSRGRTCAKGVVTPNQLEDPDRILYPLRRAGERGEGRWEQVSWDEALEDIGGRIRRAILENRRHEVMYHVGRPGVGHRRPQQPHQRLLVLSTPRTFPLVRRRPSIARLCERADDPVDVVAPRDGALLQPARAADHRGQIEGRDADLYRSAPVELVGQGRHLAAGLLGH
jgi:hypothetical protein